MIFGTEIVIPAAGKARDPIASTAGLDPIRVSTTVGTNCVGLNAGLVVNESSAAVMYFATSASAFITHCADSWLPNFALMLCSSM